MFRCALLFVLSIGKSSTFYYDPQLYVPKYRDYLEAQGNLTRDLFKNYEKDVSPVYAWFDTTKPLGYDPDAPKRFNYTLFLYDLKLVEVDEPKEQVSVVLELMEYWYDPRLSWNASDYKNVTAIFTRQDKVWSPTLTPFGM
uniref:Neur_chan_LBD domain-containing protein n=1 Tax=Caenorhabditis tropicalis TaxID=1561998 RepID=A0A1I7TZL8_9PELO